MAGRTLKQRLIGGVGAQAYAQLVQIIVRLGEVPAFLAIWSATRYGEWLVLAAIPTYLSLADGGFATTSGREMTMRLGNDDRDGALCVYQSSWALLTAITVGVLALVIGLLYGTPLIELVAVHTDRSDVRLALILLSAAILLGFQTGLLYGVFCAEKRYDLGTWISANFLLVDLIASVAGAWSFNSLAGAAAGLLASRLLLLLLYSIVLRRVAPWCRIGFRHASRAQLRALAKPALGSMAFPVGIGANISGMRILVGAVLGPAAVPAFSAMRTLARAAQMPTLLVIRILEPELAIAYGERRMDVFRMLFRRSCQIATWGGIVMLILALVGGELFFSTWVHDRFALDLPSFLMLLAASGVNGMWYTALQVAYATNRTHAIALPFALIYGVGCVAAAWGLMRVIGFPGASAAILIAELAMTALVVPLMLRLADERAAAFFETMLTPPVTELRRLLARRRRRLV